jgi:hypothetical protein
VAYISNAISPSGISKKASVYYRRRGPQIVLLTLVAATSLSSLVSELLNATVSAGSPKALLVQHDQIGWLGRPQELTVTIPEPNGRLIAVSFDDEFNHNFSIEKTEPAANTIAKSADGKTFKFQSSGSKDLTVKLTLRPVRWGYNTGVVRAVVPEIRAADVRMSQDVLP